MAASCATVAERYLRRVHELGYPKEEDRRQFNGDFYSEQPKVDGPRARDITARFHRLYLQRKEIPQWVQENPELMEMYNKVHADFKQKYPNGAARRKSKSSGNGWSNWNKEEGRSTKNSMNRTIMDDQLRIPQNNEKRRSLPLSFNTTVNNVPKMFDHRTEGRQKEVETIRDESFAEDDMSTYTGGPLMTESDMRKKIYSLEKERNGWRKRCREIEDELTTKLAQLDDEYKTTRLMFADEKANLLQQLLDEKSRTIELLSYQ